MIYKYISQLSNMQRRLIDRLAKDKDYSGTEGKLIHYLFENRDKTVYQKNIESVFGLRASTATQIIASLEKSGLVKRVPSSTDGRYKEIVLTEKAERYKEDVYRDMQTLEYRDMQTLEEQIVCGITPEQLEIWRGVTDKMIGNLCK